MALTLDEREQTWAAQSEANPFAEVAPTPHEPVTRVVGYAPWRESVTPFAERLEGLADGDEAEQLLTEAFAELRDEAFDEAVAYLAEETEQAVAERFANESASSVLERQRFADAQLSSVRFEALQYLDALEGGLAGLGVDSLTDEQLNEVLDRFDPQTSELSPAGEEFIGGLIRKAKKAVKWVAKTAKKVGTAVGKAAGALIGPILKKLRGLIQPLLRRVLSFAIGRLPKPLQPAARKLAGRLLSESETESVDEAPASPANLTDVEALAEGFDAALAEAMAGAGTGAVESEDFAELDTEGDVDGRELEMLAEARSVLIDRMRTADDEDNLAPSIEQFVPVLLGALRLGINLVGRPKVVNFLAGYLASLIRRWVGPQLSKPLSNAIVDTGLRLISLEAEAAQELASSEDAGPVALASVIEDTVRRLAESEDYVLENEDLMQLSAAEAFSQAVATHFPAKFVKPGLQHAPSVGGAFITRRARSLRPYLKYSRAPEVEITAQIADTLPTFAGSTVGASLRAAGAKFPVRARMHIYQAAVGTTLPRMIRIDRAGGRRGHVSSNNVYPLTPEAAGLLLREPKLGAAVPAAYLRTRHRIAVGQRFYVLEPVGPAGGLAATASLTTGAAAARVAPSRSWIVVNLRRAQINVGFYLSEVDAQAIATAIRQGRGAPALLQALNAAYLAMDRSASGRHGHVRVVREDGEDFEEFAERTGRLLPPGFTALLRKRLRAWVLPALANWTKTDTEAFARAAAHPDPGVTLRVRLTSVPGLDSLRQLSNGAAGAAGSLSSLRGTPAITITVAPGGRPT